MKVYRVQAKDGRGPFRPGLTKHWSECNNRPMAIQDAFGLDWLKECRKDWMYGCGCLSLKELAVWFSKNERMTLCLMGYQPVEIEADIIIRKRNGEQVIFGCRKSFAEIAKEFSWKSLEE